jgi:SAM-dependent methyltransferase
MEKNRQSFKDGEADKWFKRNQKNLEANQSSEFVELLTNWLQPFQSELSNILEIGCGSGHQLHQLASNLMANGFGVEPSSDAVNYIGSKFPSLQAKVGFGDNVPYTEKFDLVHLGFFLYLVDREFFLRCVSEADRLVKFGGFLSIIDFETPFPYSNDYGHQRGVYSHKQNYSDVFVASGLYTVVNKFHFSHNGFFFDTQIDERVSLTLLFKETDVFGEK